MDAEERAYADANGTAWCGVCRRLVAIADEYDTDTGDRFPRIRGYVARPLFCGHDDSTPMTDDGPASDATAAGEALAGVVTAQRLARSAAAQDLPW